MSRSFTFCSFRHRHRRRPPVVADGVVSWAAQCLTEVLESETKSGRSLAFSHFIVATTCPETLCPSLGQSLQALFPKTLGSTPTFDLVQGCAGSVTGLTLAIQLATQLESRVLFIAADTASRAVSERNELHPDFSDGVFAVVVDGKSPGEHRLLASGSQQFSPLLDTVTVGLGHVTRELVLQSKSQEGLEDAVGLHFHRRQAMKLVAEGEAFVQKVTQGLQPPEVAILHQVNSRILQEVRERAFGDVPEFIDDAVGVGNCGVASVGVILSRELSRLKGKRVFLCSFGTGGVISAAYLQL